MTLEPNDPRLTAYALGELDDDEEHVAIEAEVTTSDTLRRAVADIRTMADRLTLEFGKEPVMHLTDPQKDAITRAAESPVGSPVPKLAPMRSGLWAYKVPLGIAASVAILLEGASVILPSFSRARESSRALVRAFLLKAGGTSAEIHPGTATDSALTESSDKRGERGSKRRPAEAGASDESLLRIPPVPAPQAVTVQEIQPIVDRLTAKSRVSSTPASNSERPILSGGSGSTGSESNPGQLAGLPEPGRTVVAGDGHATFKREKRIPNFGQSAPGLEMQRTIRKKDYGAADEDEFERMAALRISPARESDASDGRTIAKKLRALGYAGGSPFADMAPSRAEYTPETYDHIAENPFVLVRQNALSTFSIDVDTASYANVRRFLNAGSLPPPGAVRIEELINYFTYDYPQPSDEHPFSVNVEVGACPWKQDHYLARVGLKGYEIPPNERPPSNLVFLIDVSGSMHSPNKLPLVKEGLKLLAGQLTGRDRVAMVVYAGASGLVLPSTPASNRGAIVGAINQLQAGGSTNGGAGIQLAYDTADANFIEGGVNRVILATDGDFNVGITSQDQLVRLIEEQAKTGVFLSVLGFGMGNLKDSTLGKLADKGNGNYAYIDTLDEAKKVLVDQIGGTLVTIAKDVKIQIEFNPLAISAYRLIGYENRVLAAQDFNDDKKDAGEIGAGHTVTALYELVPAGVEMDVPSVDPLKYQTPTEVAEAANDNELMTVKLRYKEPDEYESRLIEVPVGNPYGAMGRIVQRRPLTPDFHFASAVAAFGMLLRGSEYAGDATYDSVLALAGSGLGQDATGYRAEFVGLVQKARSLHTAGNP